MNPMNDPIYKAISTLCAFKGKATYAEVASVAGVKKQKAIDCLLTNKHLLKMDKNGCILGFISHEANICRKLEAAQKNLGFHDFNEAVNRKIKNGDDMVWRDWVGFSA
jgi:hypothetical protein